MKFIYKRDPAAEELLDEKKRAKLVLGVAPVCGKAAAVAYTVYHVVKNRQSNEVTVGSLSKEDRIKKLFDHVYQDVAVLSKPGILPAAGTAAHV